jgi:tetratricopeptide (TPR) repeat protein
MLKSKLLIFAVILCGLAVTGFQCSSTELTSAKLYIQQKNYAKALEALEKEVQKNPKSDEGYYLLGVVYGEQEQYKEMVEAFNKSVEASPKYATEINSQKVFYWANLFNKGVNFYQRGSKTEDKDSAKVYFDKSIAAFDNSIFVEPDSADSYRNLAFVYLSNGENEKAITPLRTVILKDTSAEGFRFLGEILYNKGVQAQATDSLKAQEHFEDAIKVLEQGRKFNPSDSDILLLLSNSYIAANKIEIAKDAFKAGIEAEPGNQYYRYNYGVILLGAEDYVGAEEQFVKALEIDPNYENAIYNLAVTYVRWGTAMSKEAEEKGENNTDYKKKYELALPYLEKVVEKKNEDAQVWELIGRVYTILGMQDKATGAFNKADEIRKR